MARRSILSATERDSLLALPESQDDLILHYSFTESDLSMIRQRRGDANRIGFAVQLCLLRYPGYALAGDMPVPAPVIQWIARQVQSDAAAWPQYGVRDETRREHFQEIRAYLSLSTFGLPDFRKLVHCLADLAMQTCGGMGYTRHMPFEHIYRHHRRYRITEGSEQIQIRKVAAHLFGFTGRKG